MPQEHPRDSTQLGTESHAADIVHKKIVILICKLIGKTWNIQEEAMKCTSISHKTMTPEEPDIFGGMYVLFNHFRQTTPEHVALSQDVMEEKGSTDISNRAYQAMQWYAGPFNLLEQALHC